MSGPLPPTFRIVDALVRGGHVAAAMELATHAITRGDRDVDVLRRQLERLARGEPLDLLAEPPAALDRALALAMLDRYRFHEALCLLRVVGVQDELVDNLREALAPIPDGADPSFKAALHLVRAGQAPSAHRALSDVVERSVAPAEWLTQRVAVLGGLVRGDWRETAAVEPVTREAVLAKIRGRDLVGALEAAKEAGSRELAGILQRLVEATERVFAEKVPEASDPMTVPMKGHRVAEFHVRMGVLRQADRAYRRLLKDDPSDEPARARLADVIALRQALGEDAAPIPPRVEATVHWLDKKRRPAREKSADWGSGSRYPKFEEAFDERTDVVDPTTEAELLLQLGKAEQALDLYRILAIRHPEQRSHQRRIREIEQLIAQRVPPMAAEVTVRADLRKLSSRAVRTNPRLRLDDVAPFHPEIEVGEPDDATTELSYVHEPDEDLE